MEVLILVFYLTFVLLIAYLQGLAMFRPLTVFFNSYYFFLVG